MRIVNEKTLDSFRSPGMCDWCYKSCAAREPHHVLASAMGSANRLDVRINLMGLGSSRPFPMCPCHGLLQQAGRNKFKGQIPRRSELFERIAHRERISLDVDLEQVLWTVQRLPRDARPHHLDAACQGLTREQRRLVVGILEGR